MVTGLGTQNRTYDTLLEMKDAGLVAASAAWQVDAAAKIIDLGATTVGHRTEDASGPIVQADVVIDVTALEIASNDEIYDLIIQGSNDSDFGTAANIVELVSVNLSAKEVKKSDSDRDDVVGRIILPFRNERDGTVYRYIRGYTAIAGTIATGINFTARLAKRW